MLQIAVPAQKLFYGHAHSFPAGTLIFVPESSSSGFGLPAIRCDLEHNAGTTPLCLTLGVFHKEHPPGILLDVSKWQDNQGFALSAELELYTYLGKAHDLFPSTGRAGPFLQLGIGTEHQYLTASLNPFEFQGRRTVYVSTSNWAVKVLDHSSVPPAWLGDWDLQARVDGASVTLHEQRRAA